MTKLTRLLPLAVSSVYIAVSLSACGGSSPTSSTPTPAVATPIPCTRDTLFQGSGSLPANTADFESFTTTTTGRVDVSVDWTFPSSKMGVGVAQGACSFAQLQAGSCTLLLQLTSPPKPLKGSAPNVGPGTYGLVIVNPNSVEESVSVQVVLSSSSCPTAASVASQSTREPFSEIRRELMGILDHSAPAGSGG